MDRAEPIAVRVFLPVHTSGAPVRSTGYDSWQSALLRGIFKRCAIATFRRAVMPGFKNSLVAGFIFIIWAAFAASLCSAPFDWPQWQGTERTAVSKETGLLKSWPKEGPPLAWKAGGLGEGFGSPSVANGRI